MENIPVYRVQLVREPWEVAVERKFIGCPEDAAKILRPLLESQDREHLVVLMLDSRSLVIGVHTVAIGSLTVVVTSQREIFKAAILANADRIILGHNHPSGNSFPSGEDFDITTGSLDAGELLGIEVEDHIIIGAHDRYVSFKEINLMSNLPCMSNRRRAAKKKRDEGALGKRRGARAKAERGR